MEGAYALLAVVFVAASPLIGANSSNYTALDQDSPDVKDLQANSTEADEPKNSTENDVTPSLDESDASSDELVLNEVELNPMGNDTGGEWVELYNSGDTDVNTSYFAINTSKSVAVDLPDDVIIEPGEIFFFELDGQMLSNIAEALNLINTTSGAIVDSTPSLVDSRDDDYTWQRFPDGQDEWQFLTSSREELNDPSASSQALDSNSTRGRDEGNAQCLGAESCVEGVVVRIVDGDTLYVRVNDTAYKIDLALANAPSTTEEGFIESTSFTRSLCLGSKVVLDQDDNNVRPDGSIVAAVYCSSDNLNKELLENGHATLNIAECSTSEFAETRWAQDHGC
ncbi:MAG: thermonuclease family protein [Nitrososphaera sp.]|nr:thermonuclease family protein [Nitrososphaera sp.]